MPDYPLKRGPILETLTATFEDKGLCAGNV